QTNKQWKAHDNREKAYLSRTIGWSLVYFIFSKKEGAALIGKMLEYMVNHQTDASKGFSAVELYYPGGVKSLEHDWKYWLLQEDQLIGHLIDSQRPAKNQVLQNKKDKLPVGGQ
ncbi:MAG: hypothetical protein AAGI07_20410, partial [Bacteroidota bacterium]